MYRKIIGIFFAFLFVLITYKYPLDFIKELPETATVTQSEIEELGRFGLRYEDDTVDAGIIDGAGNVVKNIKAFFGGIVPFKKIKVNVIEDYNVKAGGMPIGFCLNTKGVIVVGINDVLTEEGYVQPSKNTDITKGDCITEIEGVAVNNAQDLNVVVNSQAKLKNSLKITILRMGKALETTITPALDKDSGTYKLGLWIRDNASGMGTVTYIKNEDSRFGSLGHAISDTDTGVILPVSKGQVYKTQIVGVLKGGKNQAGELRGTFIKTDRGIGSVDKNNKFGVFGNFNNFDAAEKYILPIGTRALVKPGKAKILTSLGNGIEEFDIEIVKVKKQKAANEKSMVIKVVDKELIARAGGIVQGMSGSPIIQNGKIIGAVTHVFLNDASKGYGVFIDWMIDE